MTKIKIIQIERKDFMKNLVELTPEELSAICGGRYFAEVVSNVFGRAFSCSWIQADKPFAESLKLAGACAAVCGCGYIILEGVSCCLESTFGQNNKYQEPQVI